MSYVRRTFQQLTAPGYFDYSSLQTDFDKKINEWFNSITGLIQDNINLMDSIFRLWASRSYAETTVTMTPWIKYLLTQNGIGWFNQGLEIAIQLLIYVTRSYPMSAVLCFQQYFTFLQDVGWITQPGQILFSTATPANFSETFLIYSTSPTLPPKPDGIIYTPLTWQAPPGWSKTAENATYYMRGYVRPIGPEAINYIVWCNPLSVNVVYPMQDVTSIAELPIFGAEGNLVGVYDDGSGDIGSIYYFDETATWRKTTGKNANQGQLAGQVPPQPGSSVFAPESDTYSSGIQPPVDGPSEGFGYYGIYSQLELASKRINIIINLTEDGVDNLGLIVILFRRIKPTLNSLYVSYTTPTNPDLTEIEIFDSGAV